MTTHKKLIFQVSGAGFRVWGSVFWRFGDAGQPRNTSKDPLHVSNGPMTRSRTKALKEAMNALVLKVSTRSELQGPLEYQEET